MLLQPESQSQIEREAVDIADAANKEYHQVGYYEPWFCGEPARR